MNINYKLIQPFEYDNIVKFKLSKGKYNYSYAGENLAMGFGKDEKAQNLAWKNSPTHYANIVKPKFTEVGIAVCKDRVVVEFASPVLK
jgi:uncharacterized protein YkwD